MIYIYYTYLNKSQHQTLLKKHAGRFPIAFQERLSKFKRWQDQQASLLGRVLLENGIKQIYNCTLPEIVFGKYGKPIFKDSNIHFNISHSHQLVVCAITENIEIGIDIEYQKSIDIQDFKFQMTEKEWNWISTSENSTIVFYEYWTKKEAVIKAAGRGFSVDLKSFEVTEGTKEVVLEDQNWRLVGAFIDADYSCYFATKQAPNMSLSRVNL